MGICSLHIIFCNNDNVLLIRVFDFKLEQGQFMFNITIKIVHFFSFFYKLSCSRLSQYLVLQLRVLELFGSFVTRGKGCFNNLIT